MVVVTRSLYRILVGLLMVSILMLSFFVTSYLNEPDETGEEPFTEAGGRPSVSTPDPGRTGSSPERNPVPERDTTAAQDLLPQPYPDLYSRAGSYEPGQMKWWYHIPEGGPLSTPCLTDLNGDLTMEVVVASAADVIYALTHDGKNYWPQPYVAPIEPQNKAPEYQDLDWAPTPMFSSVVSANVDAVQTPEIFVGIVGGLLALRADGTKMWIKTPLTAGSPKSFATPAICDIEGDYAGYDYDGQQVSMGRDMEVVFGCDDGTTNSWLSVIAVDKDEVMTFPVGIGGEGAHMGSSIVTAEMSGLWEFEEPGMRPLKPGDPGFEDIEERLYMEFETGTHDQGVRIYGYEQDIDGKPSYRELTENRALGAHQTSASSVVGNFSEHFPANTPQEHEILNAGVNGHYDWGSWEGMLYLYNKDGIMLWTVSMASVHPGAKSGSGILSSPAVADMQSTKSSAPGEPIKYEVVVADDAGFIMCFDVDTHNLLWSYEINAPKNYLGRIMSSPAMCNIFSDNQVEVVVGANNGKVYCFDGDPTDDPGDNNNWPPPPYNDNEWDGDMEDDADGYSTNGADVLWACDTHYEDIYGTQEIVAGDGTKGGGGMGISSAVVADIDNDGWLEAVIGDKKGFVYCIVVGPCIKGQIDWPQFHNDLNRSGLYKPKVDYGVDLTPHRGDYNGDGSVDINERDTMFKMAEPGSTVTYNITLLNKLRTTSVEEMDLVWINISAPPENWTAWITYSEEDLAESDEGSEPIEVKIYETPGDPTSKEVGRMTMYYRHMKTKEILNLRLHVSAPDMGEVGELAKINVSANSSLQPWLRDEQPTITLLDITVDFDLEYLVEKEEDTESPFFGYKHKKVKPGYETNLPVMIINEGNINDTYNLEILNVPEGWRAVFIEDEANYTTVDIPAKKFCTDDNKLEFHANRMITVHVPDDATPGMVGAIRVRGVSQRSLRPDISILSREDLCFVEAGLSDDLVMTVEEPNKMIDPGGEVEFEVFVTNVGSTDLSQVDYSVGGDLGKGWKVEPPLSSKELKASHTKAIKIKVKAPRDALAGATLTFSLIGSVPDNPNIEGRVSMLVQVKPKYEIDVVILEPDQEGLPGMMVNYTFTVTNKGNGQEKIRIDPVHSEIGWEMQFESQEEILDPDSALDLMMNVFIPESAMVDDYILGFNVSSETGFMHHFFTTKVNQIYNIDLDILQKGVYGESFYNEEAEESTVRVWGDHDERFISPNSYKSFTLRLQNRGNGRDKIRLTLGTMEGQNYTGWEYYFNSVSNSEMEGSDLDLRMVDFIYYNSPVPLDVDNFTNRDSALVYRDREGRNVSVIEIRLWPKQIVYIDYICKSPSTHDPKSVLSTKNYEDEPAFDFYVLGQSQGSMDPEFLDMVEAKRFVVPPVLEDMVNCTLEVRLTDIAFSGRIIIINEDADEEKTEQFDDHIIIGDAQDDKLMTVVARVTNNGEIDAEDVWVYLIIDGEEVERMRLNMVPGKDPRGKIDNTRTVSFTWKAEYGDHDIDIIIDNYGPKEFGYVEESDEKNNVFSIEDYYVRPSGISKEESDFNWLLVLVMWLIRLCAVGVLVILLREGKLGRLAAKR